MIAMPSRSSSASASVPSYTVLAPSSATISSAATRPGWSEQVAADEQLPARRVDVRAAARAHDPGEHLERASVRRRQLDVLAGEPERGLDDARPRHAPELAPERVDPGGQAGDGARGRPDEVGHDLLAEDDRDLDELPGAEGTAAKQSRWRAREPSKTARVPAGEQAAHHRLGDARGERHRGGRVARRAAVGEDLGADRGRRRMSRRNACLSCAPSRRLPHATGRRTAK